MTFKKAKIYFQVLVLALLPGFVARPVMVGIHNSALASFQPQESQTLSPATPFEEFSPFRTAFRSVERETSDVTVWIPLVSGMKSPSVSEGRLTVVSLPALFTPQNFLVLRI